jgi:hypothetical protein
VFRIKHNLSAWGERVALGTALLRKECLKEQDENRIEGNRTKNGAE